MSTSAAIRARYGEGSKRVRLRTADSPRCTPSHNPWRPCPIVVTAPIPVTTTRRVIMFRILSLFRGDVQAPIVYTHHKCKPESSVGSPVLDLWHQHDRDTSWPSICCLMVRSVLEAI